MRWLQPLGAALLAALFVGGLSLVDTAAADDPPEGSLHEDTAGAEGEATAESAGEEPPIYDGDLDGTDENYDQPPLQELAPVRFLWALGLFVVFVFVMRKIAWRPLIAALDAREARVNEAHAFVASTRTEIQELISQHDARISESYDEVKDIVAAARKEAEQAKAEIIAQAETEATELQERSIAEIVAAKEEALGQLSGRVDDYTDMATEHILGPASQN